MNYIRLLNTAFELFYSDTRLNPTHISLYMALFQEWNSNRFMEEFYVNRRDLMNASKIGSKSTYHRCVSELNLWGYLTYFPSHNPYKGSRIKMTILNTNDLPDLGQYNPVLEQLAEQYHPKNEPPTGHNPPIHVPVVYQHRPTSGQALVPTINNTKQVNTIKQPKGWQEVKLFFFEKDFNADEGKKFFEYYQNRDWKTSNGNDIRDWRAIAINWMDRTELFDPGQLKNKKEVKPKFKDHLKTNKNKNYDQPL
ncbi:hypothetical protein FNB79_15180 [Formosa sediminum]|uniref:Uncharacterized protein n=1 Tax=Formosa sediminum TaxID=2594004 RepID=A0A516GUR0_9FLAO|nr:hypothetical protein [Formosa sediminum]QDO95259.1 hypothetical protein FNB79_15180 [Formosa sediminum]